MAQFALNNGISNSTFNDWVIKYKISGNSFCNITNKIEYKEKVCRLIHKRIKIEFDEKLVERILRVLKEW